MLRYRVALTPDDNDTLLVTCPDLPEVTSFGEDEADALARAADAVASALQGRITDRRPIPAPSPGPGPVVTIPALVVVKLELRRAMAEAGLRKADLARRLGVHPPQVDRLLDLDHASRLDQMEAALRALGQEIDVTVRAAA